MGAAALVVGTASLAISSFIASLTLEGGSWIAESAEWGEVARMFGKTVFGLVPYVTLAVFFAVLTSSSGAAIGLSLGYAVAEGIVVGILASFEWFERVSGFILGPAVDGWLETSRDVLISVRRRRDRVPTPRRQPCSAKPCKASWSRWPTS